MEYIVYFLAFIGFVFLIWFFKIYLSLKEPKSKEMPIMHFKDSKGAFEYSSKYMNNDIIQYKPTIAISVQENHDPFKPIMVKVAGDPPFFAHASTTYIENHKIQKGDLLGIIPFEKSKEITTYMNDDERKQWLFVVISAVLPRYHNEKKMWAIERDFLKEAKHREKCN